MGFRDRELPPRRRRGRLAAGLDVHRAMGDGDHIGRRAPQAASWTGKVNTALAGSVFTTFIAFDLVGHHRDGDLCRRSAASDGLIRTLPRPWYGSWSEGDVEHVGTVGLVGGGPAASRS